ncbi:MAG: IMPACT family protein [Bacteroidales bacterium]|nr:IMPACT family protein [Bacteroidales bacterium]
MVRDTYRTVASRSEGLFKDNGSRFIALAYPVETPEEVKAIVDGLRKEYHDARHHCFAYRLGVEGAEFRASDDGEPAGSAGRQILGQIDSKGLSDTIVVVVRYFGGIKLGIRALRRAYKTSTAEALENAEIIDKVARKRVRLSFGYLAMNDVMKLVKDNEADVKSQSFDLDCEMEVLVRLASLDAFVEAAAGIGGCKVEIID